MKKIGTTIAAVAMLSFSFSCLAQTKYWIFLKDKNTTDAPAISPKTLQNRLQQGLTLYDETDLPVKKEYLQQLQTADCQTLNISRWFNAVSARLTAEQLQAVQSLPFVSKVQPINGQFYIAKTQPNRRSAMAPVMTQVQADEFKKAGLNGKGITIGVIDAGFLEAPTNNLLKHIFDRKAILDKRDYVNPPLTYSDKFYTTAETFSDFHGTEVMSAISGANRSESAQNGLATESQFYLARTDHGTREFRGEEDNWVAAMEWMDSLGVRLINTSLGYAQGFTDPNENYQINQMDGKTSIISQAAQLAADKKGILVIVSAGNEGDDPSWRIISTPADAQGVLAIGATNQRYWNRIGYSSIGPEFLPYLKPNVSCFSLYGTSLSAPVITGFAACLMQANPTLTNKQLINLIEKSAHLYPYGNNFVGYGVPLASRALALLQNPAESGTTYAREIKASGTSHTLKLPGTSDMVSVFHKKSSMHVLTQEIVRLREGQLTIQRLEGETHTTIDLKTEVIEVVWE
ncbi:peptidase S8 [Runella rosea]|uniref:Peptidase S8 n=1 Tax=Runella rosea TaxID=2259595 RepID=A0A344TCF0_9BACT|nr:S8 family serine peptidase [Runella rosea]AXE16321.1 peptidase S8 [Runella rosea]